MSHRYAIAKPSEYLVLTGAGINDIRICKKAIVMPFQRVCFPFSRANQYIVWGSMLTTPFLS